MPCSCWKPFRRPTASQCHLCISRSHFLLVCEAYPKILLLKHPIKNELSTIMDCGNLMNCSLAREDPLVCRDGIPVIFSARCIWHLSPLFHFLWFIDKQTYRQTDSKEWKYLFDGNQISSLDFVLRWRGSKNILQL